jgi:hypothetical protein
MKIEKKIIEMFYLVCPKCSKEVHGWTKKQVESLYLNHQKKHIAR